MTILVVVVFMAVFVTAICSLFEAVLYSTRMGALEAAKAAGTKTGAARQFIEMKKNMAVPIAAVVILTQFASATGGTVAGYFAANVLGASNVAIFSVAFTLLLIFFGEIMPKTLGSMYWRSLWASIVFPITVLKYALYPIVFLSQRFANLFTRGRKVPTVTEAEILAVVRMGAIEGEITPGESALVHNIIHLESKQVREIMTPRTVIFSLDASMTVGEAIRAVDQKGFTRIPIFEGDRENVVGYIMIHDLASAKTLAQPDTPIRAFAKPISFTPATRDALALLTSFLKRRRHIAVVVDEYGGVAGLVTLEDLIETLLGDEIVDETDRVVDLQERARQMRRQLPTP